MEPTRATHSPCCLAARPAPWMKPMKGATRCRGPPDDGVVALKGRRNWDFRTYMGTRARPLPPAGWPLGPQPAGGHALVDAGPVLEPGLRATAQMYGGAGVDLGCAGERWCVPGAPPSCHPPRSRGPYHSPSWAAGPDWLLAPGPEGRVRSVQPLWIHSPGVLSKVPADAGAELGLRPRDPGLS